MLGPGIRFDRYEIESLLGEGGMGRVFLARDTRLGRKVALKVLHPAFAEAGGSARLLREARSAAALDHPNAVAIFDVGEANGVAYLAMEYLEGRSLRDYVGDPSVSISQRLRWLADVARALAAAHARGLVHRDIKPANIIIKDDGAVKVLDFGIARPTQQVDSLGPTAQELAPPSDTFTRSGTVVGTPDYMAPEQMLSKPVDGRTDQFSWGVTAYELLSGNRPWSDSTDFVRLVAEIVSPEPVRTLAGQAAVPRVISDLVDRALSKEPSERFASMNEIVRAIDALTLVRRSLPPRGRKRSLAAGLVAVGAAVTLSVVVALKVPHRERDSDRDRARVRPSDAVPSASSQAATSMVDLPVSRSARPDAVLAFKRARQDMHDASIWRASYELRTASRLDPSFVAPLVSLLTWDMWDQIADPRATFSSARQLRADLSERDKSLLDAMAPFYATDLADVPLAATKTLEVATRYPEDAEAQLIAGMWLGRAKRTDEARAAFARALQIDGSFAAVHWARAGAEAGAEAQRAELEKCAAMSPSAGSCVRGLARLKQLAGDCAGMEVAAAKLQSVEPDFEGSYLYSLNSALSHGGPRAETTPILAALEASIHAQARADGKPDTATTAWPALVAFHYGAFQEGLSLVATVPDDDTRSRLSILAAEESGDTGRAAAEARAQATRRRMRFGGNLVTDATTLRALKLDAHEPEGTVAALAEKWSEEDAHLDGALGARIDALAIREAVATTGEEAQAAVRGVDDELTGAVWTDAMNSVEGAAALGRTFLLAGRADEAIRPLEWASHACGMAVSEGDFTFERMHASLALAEADEKTGKTVQACTELGRVVTQWGKATPRSVTADEARKRQKRLGCP
jgi:serine/threonine-protein kinase